MATSFGQYAPVFLPGEPPSLTEKPGRPVYRVAKARQDQSDPVHINTRLYYYYFACDSSAPVRVECEGGATAWLVGTLAVPSMQGQTASAAGVMVLSESFFQPLVAGNRRPVWLVFLHSSACSGTLRAPLPGVLLCCSACQAHRGGTLAGVLLCRLASQALKRAPWRGPTL